jgi:two-component system alkaline phosphatase synthesis response regulator PhoP
MRERILVVEDEPGLVLTLTDRLVSEGYLVDTASDGEAGLAKALSDSYDLIILDWMMPKKNGLDVCRDLRKESIDTPILMLTARSQTVDKVVGLQLGADDYLTKPFEMMELMARVAALLRRAPSRNSASALNVQFGNVRVDFKKAEVVKNGEPVLLSAREFQLLRYLVERRGETISRDELLQKVWGYQSMPTTRTRGEARSRPSACPPRPSVASTNVPPRSGRSDATASARRTGR